MRSQCRLISASDTWSERRKPKISRGLLIPNNVRCDISHLCDELVTVMSDNHDDDEQQ